MKKTIRFLFLLPLVLFIGSKVEDKNAGASTQINVDLTRNSEKASNLLSIDGFTVLDPSDKGEIRSVSEVLFNGDELYVLDNETDMNSVMLFDVFSGNIKWTIGHQGNVESSPGEYLFIRDIALTKHKNLLLFDDDNLRITEFNNKGAVVSVNNTDYQFTEMEDIGAGETLLFNEFHKNRFRNQPDDYLLVIDQKGTLKKSHLSFPVNQPEIGFGNVGFLKKSGDDVFFNPPFSNKVWKWNNGKPELEYSFNFGASSLPENIDSEAKRSIENYAAFTYLADDFIKCGGNIVYSFNIAGGASTTGIYNEQNGASFVSRNAEVDALYELILFGKHFRKNENTFANLIMGNRVAYLFRKNKLKIEELEEKYPALLRGLKKSAENNLPILIYFSFR